VRASGRRADSALALGGAARGALALVLALGGAAASSGCEPGEGGSGATVSSTASAAPSAEPPSEDDRIVEELRRFDEERRASADFEHLPPSDGRFGADPYALREVGRDRYVGILRGADAVVLLDAELHELARVAAPASPSAVAVQGDTAFVVGERASEVRRYRVGAAKIEPRGAIPLPGVRALRGIAAGPGGTLSIVEEAEGRLITLVPDAKAKDGYEASSMVAGAGAFRVARTRHAVIVDCLLAHRILAYRTDAKGRPDGAPAVIENDGPLWSFDAVEDDSGTLHVASGGAENKPLDRTHGSFENIDSFVYLDRVTWDGGPRVTRVAEIDVSDHGVVVPKALEIEHDPDSTWITATGYGGEAFVSIQVRDGDPRPTVLEYFLPPGTNAFVPRTGGGMVIANPLLDEWILYRTEHLAGAWEAVAGPHDAERTAASRVGEAMIFTTLIAPWNRSEGPLSRFTCETCHFEGRVDGRTHATGRGDVRATTKPLLGLWNNRPHFSRALDPDLASVAHNEFRVAGARSNHSPIFDLRAEEHPWLADLGITDADLTSMALRRAFMTFLSGWSPRSSPITAGRRAFTDVERRGAEAFRARCEGCHEARVASDAPGSRVPFGRWESLVFSDAAPIVWGQARYEKTGVVPYVHDQGARVPSLRRLYAKQPYFTNGTARSLADVLARARFGDGAFFHDGAPAGAALGSLTDDERAAIEAFLKLL
jgi:hypothetical protein